MAASRHDHGFGLEELGCRSFAFASITPGCFFRERNNTLSSFRHEVMSVLENPLTRSRQFGQMILVLGGTLHLNGCECPSVSFFFG